jgi:glycosyltransferase involved in cell wall biosynthesis
MKGHFTFLRAAALVASERTDIRFFCIGGGDERARLEAFARELGIANRVCFTGEASDPVRALNGLDLCCSSSSFGEGFSNAIAEAMACGKNCAVTDVGDSARIVGELGTVVPADDFEALAQAMLRELNLRSASRSAAARDRIVDTFSLCAMVDRTLAVLESVATGGQLRVAAESRS